MTDAQATAPPSPRTDFDAFEAATWERRATGYERFFTAVTRRTIEPLLDAARVEQGSRHLDVATGPGDVAGAASERGARSTGVDIAEAMVDIARRRWRGVDFRRADGHALPFDDACFDAVTASFALMHLGSPEQAMGEWVRVAVPGGRVAVTVWDERPRVALFAAILDALDQCGATWPAHIPDGPSFFRFSEDAELRALLEEQGLTGVTITTIAFSHAFAGPDEVWDGIVEGSVRTAAAIRGQTAAIQRRTRAAFTERVERHYRGGTLELPISVKVAAGTVLDAATTGRR
jgi:ubiquinone/menaquinone biosynthesis C-methylase UbiE